MSIEYDKTIEELNKEHQIVEEIKFSEIDIKEKLEKNAFLLQKYQGLFQKEKFILEEKEMLYDKLVGSVFNKLRFESEKGLTKYEIEKYYIPQDPKVIQMKKILNIQHARTDFFETCLISIKSQQWSMKGFIDSVKIGL